VVILGQRSIGEKAVHTAVAGLAQVHYFTVAATLFAGHEVVAAGLLHGPLTKATLGSGRTLGTGRSFGSGLSKLLAAGHGVIGK
jgi:hypothetical protein